MWTDLVPLLRRRQAAVSHKAATTGATAWHGTANECKGFGGEVLVRDCSVPLPLTPNAQKAHWPTQCDHAKANVLHTQCTS